MHIALADGNPGDRKQMERLLGRESDKRMSSTGVLYTETFGSMRALLENPIIYDAYFLDLEDEDYDSLIIASELRKKNISSTIVLTASNKEKAEEMGLKNICYLGKPVKVAELSGLLDKLIEECKKNKIPTIEFRNREEAFYLVRDDICYMQGDRYRIHIHMKNGEVKVAEGFIENVWTEVKNCGLFAPINGKTIVNLGRIKEKKVGRCIMCEDSVLHLSVSYARMLKEYTDKYNMIFADKNIEKEV